MVHSVKWRKLWDKSYNLWPKVWLWWRFRNSRPFSVPFVFLPFVSPATSEEGETANNRDWYLKDAVPLRSQQGKDLDQDHLDVGKKLFVFLGGQIKNILRSFFLALGKELPSKRGGCGGIPHLQTKSAKYYSIGGLSHLRKISFWTGQESPKPNLTFVSQNHQKTKYPPKILASLWTK